MWISVLWAGLRVAMWITHVGGKFRHGLLERVTENREQTKHMETFAAGHHICIYHVILVLAGRVSGH